MTPGRVMAGFVPAIHAVLPCNGKRLGFKVHSAGPLARRGVDARDKRGHDGSGFTAAGITRSVASPRRTQKKRRA
jgi:hypothetical protein